MHRRLREYGRKRDFSKTPEPGSKTLRSGGRRTRRSPSFVIQEHHARRFHFDFRLEEGGVLKSWAVTREPSMDPEIKRLAIETEDHPLAYGRFEGEIPRGEYGAGSVEIWDRGVFSSEKNLADSIEEGRIDVVLDGERLQGRFILVRIAGEGERSRWLFFKGKPKVKRLVVPA